MPRRRRRQRRNYRGEEVPEEGPGEDNIDHEDAEVDDDQTDSTDSEGNIFAVYAILSCLLFMLTTILDIGTYNALLFFCLLVISRWLGLRVDLLISNCMLYFIIAYAVYYILIRVPYVSVLIEMLLAVSGRVLSGISLWLISILLADIGVTLEITASVPVSLIRMSILTTALLMASLMLFTIFCCQWWIQTHLTCNRVEPEMCGTKDDLEPESKRWIVHLQTELSRRGDERSMHKRERSRLKDQVETAKAAAVIQEKENDVLRGRIACIVCEDNERDTVLLPCKHFNFCEVCAGRINDRKCPLCRKRIDDQFRLFT